MSDRLRAALATIAISSSRVMGTGVSDEALVKREGFRDMNEYWEVELFEPRRVSSFVTLLEGHFFGPTGPLDRHLYALEYIRDLRASIKFLSDFGEVQLINVPGQKEPLVWPRKLVESLLSMPKRAHLIPESLKAFIEVKPAVATPDPHATFPERKAFTCISQDKRKNGPLSVKRERTAAAMLDALRKKEITPDELKKMPGKNKMKKYGFDNAGRTTVADAMKDALSEFAGVSNSGK
jgi:hypothetical protein